MTLTVKLDPALERSLERRSAERGVSKSAVVKEALAEYLAREPAAAYEAGKDLFGRHGSGARRPQVDRSERYTQVVDAKRRSRR